MAAALLAVVVMSGCAGMRPTVAPLNPFEECRRAAGAYQVAQIGIEAAVTTPTIDPDTKAALKAINTKAMEAPRGCASAALRADGDTAVFWTGVLAQAMLEARRYVGPKPAVTPLGAPPGETIPAGVQP